MIVSYIRHNVIFWVELQSRNTLGKIERLCRKKKIKICNFNFKDNEKYNDIAGFTDFIPSTYGY